MLLYPSFRILVCESVLFVIKKWSQNFHHCNLEEL